jgi:DNA-directed RNA polymerase specialized sigma24 family protein
MGVTRTEDGRGRTGSWLAGEAAFAAFYRDHSRAVLVFFTRRTYDVEAALDLTAETFAQAFASRRRLRVDTDAQAGAWLSPPSRVTAPSLRPKASSPTPSSWPSPTIRTRSTDGSATPWPRPRPRPAPPASSRRRSPMRRPARRRAWARGWA